MAAAPDSVLVEAFEPTVVLQGQGFVGDSRARWNGQDRPTRFLSENALQVTLSAADLTTQYSGQLTVYNPPPGGGLSGILSLRVVYGEVSVSSVTPNNILLGDTTVTLVIRGAGFVSQSSVWIRHTDDIFGSLQLETTFVSSTELRSRIRGFSGRGGAFVVLVQNPARNYVAGPQLTVRNPVPTIGRVTPDSLLHDAAQRTITVFGSKFMAGTQLHWNGSPRTTTVANDSVLTAELTTADITGGQSGTLTVHNPAPGGGASAGFTFRVVPAPPRVTLLAPSYARAGGPGFTLTINGRNFTPASVVEWNGESRPTTFLNSTTISIDVGVADVASAGTSTLRVVEPSSGRHSDQVGFPVLTTSVSVTSSSTVALTAHDLAWDSSRDMVYASVASTSAALANHVVAINPATGAVVDEVFVGSDPGPLAISDDGAFLFVGVRGAPRLVRINLAAMALDLEIAFAADPFLGSVYAEDIVAIPGAPRSVAVSLMNRCCSPRHQGVAIFDDAVRRPQTTPGHTGANRITRGPDASAIYGYNNETTEFGLRRISITAQGLQETANRWGAFGAFYVDMEYAGGLLYATNGIVAETETLSQRGTLSKSGLVMPDAQRGRVFVLSGDEISAHHALSLNEIAALNFSGLSGARRMIRWGSDGLAFAVGDSVVLIRSTLVQ